MSNCQNCQSCNSDCKPEEPLRRDVCWYCGGQLVWQSDFDAKDVGCEQDGIVTYLECSQCGARVEYLKLEDDEVGIV